MKTDDRPLKLPVRVNVKILVIELVALLSAMIVSPLRGDIVDLVNGDHYSGTVLSVTMTNVAVRSEIQGVVSLPRDKVARITFREVTSTLLPAPSGQLRQPNNLPKGADTNFIARVQQDILNDAGPEAKRKYQELARGLMSGSLSVSDLRKQAQQTIREAEKTKEELGPEADELLNSYLEILRRFVQESAPNNGTR